MGRYELGALRAKRRRCMLALRGWPGLLIARMTGLRPVGLLATLLDRIVLMLGLTVATTAAAAAAATFLARAFHGTITRLALFHGGQCILTRRARVLLPLGVPPPAARPG